MQRFKRTVKLDSLDEVMALQKVLSNVTGMGDDEFYQSLMGLDQVSLRDADILLEDEWDELDYGYSMKNFVFGTYFVYVEYTFDRMGAVSIHFFSRVDNVANPTEMIGVLEVLESERPAVAKKVSNYLRRRESNVSLSEEEWEDFGIADKRLRELDEAIEDLVDPYEDE